MVVKGLKQVYTDIPILRRSTTNTPVHSGHKEADKGNTDTVAAQQDLAELLQNAGVSQAFDIATTSYRFGHLRIGNLKADIARRATAEQQQDSRTQQQQYLH